MGRFFSGGAGSIGAEPIGAKGSFAWFLNAGRVNHETHERDEKRIERVGEPRRHDEHDGESAKRNRESREPARSVIFTREELGGVLVNNHSRRFVRFAVAIYACVLPYFVLFVCFVVKNAFQKSQQSPRRTALYGQPPRRHNTRRIQPLRPNPAWQHSGASR